MSHLFANRPEATVVDYVDFNAAVSRSRCGTLSRTGRPLDGEVAWRMTVTLEQFLALLTYPVWYVGKDGTGGASYGAPGAKAIPFRDAVKREDFKAYFNQGFDPSLGTPKSVDVVLLHCSTCGRFAVIDGNHHLAWIAFAGRSSATVKMTCLSGSRWCKELPDMNLICACIAEGARDDRAT